MSAFFLLLAVPSLVSGSGGGGGDEYIDCQPTGHGGISCSSPGRTANKLGKCDMDVAKDCGDNLFTGKSSDVVEPSWYLSFLAEIDLCVAGGLKGKMLIKCLEKSIEAKTFVEYSSKLNLL